MTTYSDAIGYLRDLGHEEGIPWFEMICDLAASGESTLSEHNRELLIKLFRGSGSYQRQPLHLRTAVSSALSTMAVERLERIGPFNSFKRLGDTLTASFDKRVTIIFGTNGSGKSSLCEALKILASNEVPRRPLQNIHTKSATSPAFAFKFATDLATNNWTILDPCGYKSAVLKYFDSGVALQNIQNSVQPGRIIKLTPFKLDVFETAKNLCEELRTELQQDQSTNSKILLQTLEQIRNKFNVFKDSVLASLTMPTAEILDSQIKLGEEYSEDCRLNEKLQRKSQLEKATSEEGIKIIKGEIASIRALYAGIQPLLQASDGLIEIEPISTSRMLKEKEKELEVIAKYLIPAGSTIDKLMALIRPANEIYDLNSPELSRCPLCKQGLGDSELELFKKYSELLTGELQEAIIRFRKSLDLSDEYYRIISSSIPDDWAQDSVLVSTRIDSIKKSGRLIKEIFKPGLEISHDCLEAVKDLKNKGEELLESLNEKASLIKKAETSRSALVIELNKISEECQKLLYYKLVAENLDILKEAYRRIKIDDFWVNKLPIFKSILKKITITAKKAHKELVVSDFRARLNAEYLALAEKDMSEFGVELKDIGEEGAVTVDHHIAGKRIEEVLSEGEQRIHALALFFAELET